MKTKNLLAIFLILAFTFSLYACMESKAEGPESIADVESSEDSKEPEDLSAEPEESSAEPEVSKEVSIEEEDVYVQREMTEEMKAALYRMKYRESREYDPNNENCVNFMSYYQASYYANHNINGYTLCHCTSDEVAQGFTERKIDGYYFMTPWTGSPSPLMLYLYKDGEFTTIETALKTDLINASDLYEILSSDPKYGVKAEIIESK